jgi:NADH dehydrogenase
MTNELVTVIGGSGFIGRHLVRMLAERGTRVRVAVRHPEDAVVPAYLGRYRRAGAALA